MKVKHLKNIIVIVFILSLVSCSVSSNYETDCSLVNETVFFKAFDLNDSIEVSFFTHSEFHSGEFRKLGSNHNSNSKLILNEDFFIAVSYDILEKGIKNSIKQFIANPHLFSDTVRNNDVDSLKVLDRKYYFIYLSRGDADGISKLLRLIFFYELSNKERLKIEIIHRGSSNISKENLKQIAEQMLCTLKITTPKS